MLRRSVIFERKVKNMNNTENDILRVLEKLIPKEIIDGSDVHETADMVDLDIAYRLLLVENCVQQEDIELVSNIPSVSEAKKRSDGKYEIRFIGETGPDFRILTIDQAKIMRARFLLLKGWYTSNWDRITLPKQNEVVVKFDIGFIPDVLKNS